LLDEPFRGLDTEATAAALELVQQVPRVGGLIIIASHTRALLDQFCDDYMDLTESSQAR